VRRLVAVLIALLVWPAAAAARPNVVVIETDDQTVADMAVMPHTQRLIGDAGTTFTDSYVSLSLCCPSRATFLTGQYAHNTGVWSINPPWGGYDRLRGAQTLPVWLQRAGYATGLIGKYLNGYGDRDPLEIPPGWTEFEGLESRDTYRFYGYTINDGGRLRRYGYANADYQTDVLTRRAVDFIDRRAPRRRPFFLWTTYVAPHTGQPHDFGDPGRFNGAVPAPRHRFAFPGSLLPDSPAFDEPDMRDKPPQLRRPRLRPQQLFRIADTTRRRRASLMAVDEGVGRIVDALKRAGELDDTLLVFTSDNGWMSGEHRQPGGKIVPYEPSVKVPLLMRGPRVAAGATSSRLTWNGDLAPTILDAAGARAPFALDGESLLRPGRPRAVLLEAPPGHGTNGLPLFTGLRAGRWKYVEYLDGARELFDLERDPDELHNLRRPAPRLARELARLRDCRGQSCR
jgi:N-acetylglucosamine-6-sulfatase